MSAEFIPLHQEPLHQESLHHKPSHTVHIASVIAHVQPFAVLDIQRWLETKPGVEIHAVSDQGKLVIVIEAAQEQAILNLIDDITAQPGALNAALVYHEILNEEPDPL